MGDVSSRELDKIGERGSVDRLIDRALINYESQSIVKKEAEREEELLEAILFAGSLLILNEAEEGEKKEEPSPESGEGELNPEEFAANVAMFCQNYSRLLNIPMAIANRAYLYVHKNYDKQTADRMRAILSSKFAIYLTEKERPAAPEFIGLAGKAGGGG